MTWVGKRAQLPCELQSSQSRVTGNQGVPRPSPEPWEAAIVATLQFLSAEESLAFGAESFFVQGCLTGAKTSHIPGPGHYRLGASVPSVVTSTNAPPLLNALRARRTDPHLGHMKRLIFIPPRHVYQVPSPCQALCWHKRQLVGKNDI